MSEIRLSEIKQLFRDREKIFPIWFLGNSESLKIIKQYNVSQSKLHDEKLPMEEFIKWHSYNQVHAAVELSKLYIRMISSNYSNGLYSNGLRHILRDKFSREIWLFFRLSEFFPEVHQFSQKIFSQKIIDDIIKCPFEINWNSPVKDPERNDWTKENMCRYVAIVFYRQVNKEQVEMLFPYIIDSLPFWILTYWIENGLIDIYPYSQKIITHVKGVFDKNKNDNHGRIAYLRILGGSRFEQEEYQDITQLRKFIVATNNFPELHQKLVTLFDNEVRLYNIRSFDHHVYQCKSIFESSYDIKYFQALPFINGTRMKVVKRWFKWRLE